MKLFRSLGVLAIILLCYQTCFAATIVLKQGQSITGEVIQEKETYIVVDIGFTALKIQRADIQQIKNVEPNTPQANENNEPLKEETLPNIQPEGQLYRTANLKKTTIEKGVEMISEAVVKVSTPAAMGSGFFINEDGYLITNYHVIEKETKIEVTVFQKTPKELKKLKFKKVKIEAINPFVDLALLKVEDLNNVKIKFAPLGDSSRLEIGETVFAIGNPLGLERTVTNGVISTKNRSFEGLVYIQTNADINPGNSGGPLFNLAGEVVGVTNMGYIFFGGLGFAIPINTVKSFIDNRDAFVYDKDNPNTGFRYTQPDKRRNKAIPVFLKEKAVKK